MITMKTLMIMAIVDLDSADLVTRIIMNRNITLIVDSNRVDLTISVILLMKMLMTDLTIGINHETSLREIDMMKIFQHTIKITNKKREV